MELNDYLCIGSRTSVASNRISMLFAGNRQVTSTSSFEALLDKWMTSKRRYSIPAYVVDALEKLGMLFFYSDLLYQFFHAERSSLAVQDVIFLIEESFMLLFVALRKPAVYISTNPFDWAISLGGAIASTLYRPSVSQPLVSSGILAALALVGMAVEWLGKLALGRSIGVVPAIRTLKTGGIYRFLRHPIYAGYMLIYFSVLLGAPSFQNLIIFAATAACLIARGKIEERVLLRDPAYESYSKSVRYALLPGIY